MSEILKIEEQIEILPTTFANNDIECLCELRMENTYSTDAFGKLKIRLSRFENLLNDSKMTHERDKDKGCQGLTPLFLCSVKHES